jgi:hypothetical protein
LRGDAASHHRTHLPGPVPAPNNIEEIPKSPFIVNYVNGQMSYFTVATPRDCTSWGVMMEGERLTPDEEPPFEVSIPTRLMTGEKALTLITGSHLSPQLICRFNWSTANPNLFCG